MKLTLIVLLSIATFWLWIPLLVLIAILQHWDIETPRLQYLVLALSGIYLFVDPE